MPCFVRLAVLLLVLQSVVCVVAEPPALLGTMPPKRLETYPGGEAHVTVEPAAVAVGETFRLSCEFESTGPGSVVYNGFLWEQFTLPAQVVITSSDGRLRYELLRQAPRDTQDQCPNAWLNLGGGNAVGREYLVHIGTRKDAAQRSSQERVLDLPPGEYEVQAIYNHWLLASQTVPPPKVQSPDSGPIEPRPYLNWSPSQMDDAAAVSEPVKLKVVAAAPGAMRTSVAAEPLPHIELRPAKLEAKFGQLAEVQVKMVNRSTNTVDMYNPILNQCYFSKRAVTLAILSPAGEYAGDLLVRSGGPNLVLQSSAWARVPPGGLVSSRYSFRAGHVHDLEGDIPDELPPGKYFLELRAFDHFISGRPNFSELEDGLRVRIARALGIDLSTVRAPIDSEGESDSERRRSLRGWELTHPGEEILRSQRIELEIRPRTGD